MPRWKGFAEFTFEVSARLAFVRAVEAAQTDVDQDHPGAWVVDERTISLSVEVDSTSASLDAHKRLLEALAVLAVEGEGMILVEPQGRGGATPIGGMERWVYRASAVNERPTNRAPMQTDVVVNEETDEDHAETIRTEAG